LIGGYCNSDKLIITISFLAPSLLIEVILFLVVVLRNDNTRKPEEQYKHDAYLNKKLITREISDVG
jgi:hypothetical protein